MTHTSRLARVHITTAATGISAPGTVYRMDEVPLPLRPILESPYPTDADVIQRIRQLATKRGPEKGRVDVNDVIRDVVPLIDTELRGHEVALRMDLASALPSILADRVELQQVLINFVMNGIEAMMCIDDRPRELEIRSRAHEGDYVLVAVEDTGVGIDESKVDQLFNAFFTTKPGGMGMGLSISRSIIERHGGRIWAAANPGHGATFHFALPGSRDPE